MNESKDNRAANEERFKQLRGLLERYAQPFSEGRIEKQHVKRKLSIAERFDLLFDPESARFEVATFAAKGLYEEHGDIVSAGVRTVIGKVSGRDCMVIANDSMVKGGAWFPLTIRKTLRAQEISMENHLPAIYLVDSAGIFLPLESECFPDRDHAGRIFYNNSRISALGIPQIAAVLGPSVAGGAYIPALCDELIMVKGTAGIFLAGPHLVQAAIGEKTDAESLGGSGAHSKLSGMADFEEETEQDCIQRIRRLADEWPQTDRSSTTPGEAAAPARDPDDLLDLIPKSLKTAYDMREILDCIIDAGSWNEYKKEYGKTLLTATARINGFPVGILANQRLITKDGKGEMRIGGVLYSDSADKGARFILNCNQKQIPLVFFQDVTGFMVGARAEHGGIIKDGAKMVNAVSNSRVPKITVVVGNSNGAGNYALCGRAFGPRFMLAWPTASIAVMGSEQVAKTLLAIQRSKESKPLDPEDEAKLLDRYRMVHEKTSSPYYAAARLWVDHVIDPRETRQVLGNLIRIVSRNITSESFHLGVFQV